MTTRVSFREIKDHLSDYVRRLADGGERIVVENDGEPEAALVSLEDLQRLEALDQHAAEEADLRVREAAFRRGLVEDGISVQWAVGPPMTAAERNPLPCTDPPLSEQIIADRR